MIGQDIKSINVKRFNLVVGPKRSGKTHLIQELSKINNTVMEIIYELDADKVREIINSSHAITTRKYIVIQNGDFISPKNQNMMLKILEETPDKLTIFIEALNENKIIRTIKSRANVIKLKSYSQSQIKQVVDIEELVPYCNNIGEAMFLKNFSYQQYIDFSVRLQKTISELTFRNLFMVANHTDVTSGGLDMEILFIFLNRVFEDYNMLQIIADFEQKFKNKSFNKLMLLDRMVISMWEVAREQN